MIRQNLCRVQNSRFFLKIGLAQRKSLKRARRASHARRAYRLQNSPYFCVIKFLRTIKQKVWSETGRKAKNTDCPFCVRYICSNYLLLPATCNSHWLNFDGSCQQAVKCLQQVIRALDAFSFSLICESIAAQFLTFVPHGEKTLWRKFLLRRGQRKFCFFRFTFFQQGQQTRLQLLSIHS